MTDVVEFNNFKLREEHDSMLMGTKVWSSGLILSAYLQSQKLPCKGKRVLELGAGCAGLNGMVLLNLGASSVVFTDQREVLSLLKQNLRANLNVDDARIDVRELDWQLTDLSEFQKERFDVIVASDVIFKNEPVEALLNVIEQLSTPETTILIGEEIRDTAVHEFFLDTAKRKFNVKQVRERVEQKLFDTDLRLSSTYTYRFRRSTTH